MSHRTATLSVLSILAMVLLQFTPFAARAQEQGESAEEIIARQQYMMDLRAGGPGRKIPTDAYAQSVSQHILVTPDTRVFGSTTGTSIWTSVNPSGMFYRVTNNNYISGRTNSIAFHPTDPLTFYVASAGGGVWKTTDGGTTFQVLTDNLTSLACGAVAVDPVNPSVVYVGTGELNYSLDSYYGVGVFKSTDAGASWTKIAASSTVGSSISQISIDPVNTNNLFLSGSAGVYKSTNAGATWTTTSSGGSANCILVNPLRPTVLFTTTGGYSADVIKKSTNGGASWVTITSGLPATLGRTQLALAPTDTAVVYASIANAGNYHLLGLYESTNGGATWLLKDSTTNYLGSQGWYDNAITVKPSSASAIIVGGLDIYSSTTSGSLLAQRTNWATSSSTIFAHADIHFLGYNGSVLYCGSDGGVYKSTNDGTSWTDLNATLSTLQYMSADYDPNSLLRLYGGTQDNNKESSTNGGTTWNQLTTGDGGYTVVDPVNTNYVYGQYVNGSLQRSSNFGASYIEIRPSGSSGGLFYNPYAMAPGDHNTIVYGQADLWKTTSAQTATSSVGWSQIATKTVVGGNVSSIGISAANTGKIYAGTSNGRLLATTDTGVTWNTTTGFPYVTGLSVDVTNDSVCYASFSGFTNGVHVYKTTNGGATWGNVTGNFPNIPVLCIALRTLAPRTLFLGTDLGVYKSTDDGTTWVSFNNGLPTLAIFDLKYKEGTQILLAATHGRGCWTFDYGTFSSIELASFTATPGASSVVHIAWKTLSEINNYGFEVQRSGSSTDGFSTLAGGFVKGHGTTTIPQSYAFDDSSASTGSWFYRLKQIDLDGTAHYFDPVRVDIVTGTVAGRSAPPEFALLQNHPNPFNPSTTIRFDLAADRDVSLKIYNSLGQAVSELVSGHMPAGRYSIAWNASGYASGVYFYRLEAGKFVQTKKLIVLR
jgi:photosystem II stability/assembly factor-like uncharacterized protein